MRDLLGNRITEGSLVWWLSKGIPMKVTKIMPGGLSVGDSNERTPPRITFEISIPVHPMPRDEEPQFTDFLCAMNPDAEKIIEGMLMTQRKQ